jgi:hypothetical protein|tara:strand:- start:98 stop:424 length:327 start_codon:yes stop_codon:yes gene_type:complete
MAIVNDGNQRFAIETAEFDGLIVESYTLTSPANRVDLDDGNGEPLGATVVPQRQEVSLTVQVGSSAPTIAVGDAVTYDGNNILITSVDLNETQADYQRLSISGYVKTN